MASKSEIRRVSIFINGTDADLTLKQLQASSKKLSNELAKLPVNSEEFRQKAAQLKQVSGVLNDIKADVKSTGTAFEEMKGTVTSALGALGLGIGIAETISFTKEMFKLEGQIEGVQNAFNKIGNTSGQLEKLKTASKGEIANLDLEKLAVKANNANIPIDKLGSLLAFAQQRARDTGESVDELTDKLIVGIGKNSPKALGALGVSVKEVKLEFKKTGDMVEAVSNIINREMQKSGQDVDNFGDIVDQGATRLSNLKNSLSGWLTNLVRPDLANQNVVSQMANASIKSYGDYQKVSEKVLDEMIKTQEKKVQGLKKPYEDAKKISDDYYARPMNRLMGKMLGQVDGDKISSDTKKASEAYQAERDALAALNKEKEKRTVKKESDDNGDAKLETQKEKEARLRDEFIQGSKALTEKYKEFNASQLADDQAKNDKEVSESNNKYDRLIAEEKAFLDKAKGNKYANSAELQKHRDQIDSLNKEKTDEANKIRERQERDLVDRLQAFRDDLNGKVQTEQEKELNQINKFYDEQIKDAGDNEQQQLQITADREQAIADLKIRTEKNLQDDLNKIKGEVAVTEADKQAVKIAQINKRYDEEIAALKRKYKGQEQLTKEFIEAMALLEKGRKNETNADAEDEALKKKTKASETELAITKRTVDAIFTISNRGRDADAEAQIRQLEKQKDKELSNKNLTEAQKQAINDKYAKQEADVKLQAWKADQAAAIEQALINGALAMTKVAAQTGVLSFAFDPIIAAETLAQVAIIASQSPPQFATGGYSAVDYSNPQGYVSRPTLFAKSASGRPFIAGEGNKTEYIISSEQLKDPVVANFVGMMEGIRGVKQFEQGGYSAAPQSTTGTNTSMPTNNYHGPANNEETNKLLGHILDAFTEFKNKPWEFNNRAFQQYQDNLNQFKTKANA